MRPVLLCFLLALGVGLLLRGEDTGFAQSSRPAGTDVQSGRRLFRSDDWTATKLTCLHCHADFNEKKNPDNRRIRPGHSLFNTANRPEWQTWDGRVLHSLEAAVATCTERWLTARNDSTGGKPPEKHHLRQLTAYLEWEEISPERRSKALEPVWAEAVPSDRLLKVGDEGLGLGIYRRACVSCHLEDGSGPGPSLIRNGYSRHQIAKKIRGIGNTGLDGLVMPPFPKDRLSDRQLINAVAYVYMM